MKKSFIFIIAIMLFTCSFNLSACSKKNETLKIGIISDIHCTNVTNWNENLKKSFQTFKSNNVDVIIIAGDIVDKAFESNYKIYTNTLSEVYPSQKPQMVLTMGNHDFWKVHGTSSPKAEMWALFEKCVGQSPNFHTVVKGTDFIAISPDDDTLSYVGEIDWLKTELKKIDKEKPFFVVAHANGKGTVPYSGSEELDNALKGYPNAILISGHTHYNLLDERSIYQENYTSIDAGSISYYGVFENYTEKPSTAGTSLPMGLIAEVKDKTVIFNRIELVNGAQVKAPWTVNLDKKKDDFKYTASRIDSIKPSTFSSSAKIETNCSSFGAKITFDVATDNDFVYAYRVDVTNVNNSAETYRVDRYSDFFKGLNNMASKLDVKVTSLTKGESYKVSVKAKSSMGNFDMTALEKTFEFSY